MNHYFAAELRAADGSGRGLWHYVCSNPRLGTYPVGYCGGALPCDAPDAGPHDTRLLVDPNADVDRDALCAYCGGSGVRDVPVDERCPGHPAPEEAGEHFRRYLLDHRLRLDRSSGLDSFSRCVAPLGAHVAGEGEPPTCGILTNRLATVGSYWSVRLCEAHRTADVVEVLFPAVGESWQVMKAADDRNHRRGIFRRLQLVGPRGRFLDRRGIDVRLFGIYLHRIEQADPGVDLHDHPWAFVSIILRGGYDEIVAETREASQLAASHLSRYPTPQRGVTRRWGAGTVHRMPLSEAHRIIAVKPGTLTLVLRGRRVRAWGFYLPAGWVHQNEYDYGSRRPVSEHR